jgi:hypothetical protein
VSAAHDDQPAIRRSGQRYGVVKICRGPGSRDDDCVEVQIERPSTSRLDLFRYKLAVRVVLSDGCVAVHQYRPSAGQRPRTIM